jgi:glycosyltransferase involved in cell wall biosynthesis
LPPEGKHVRLLLVNGHGDDATVGGAEQVVALLAKELPARGFEISLLRAFPGDGNVEEQTILHRADWRESEARRVRNHLGDLFARPTGSLTRAIERHRPQVVHTHNLAGMGTGVWEVCRRAGVPVVHTVHDYYLLCPRVTLLRRDGRPCRPSPLFCGSRAKRLARWSGAVDHATGVSQHVLDAHAGMFECAERHVIRNPVTSNGFGKLAPPRSCVRTIGYIGSLTEAKGITVLLEAVPELSELGLDVRVAGDGRLRQAVERAAAVEPNVSYAGPVQDGLKEEFFAGCDLGVVPSVWAEPGGPTLAMVEWLAAGRPVLVSRRGGLAEVIGSYPGSIPIEPTVDDILRAARELTDPPLWADVVAAVRAPTEDGALSAWTDSYAAIYDSLAG